MGKYALALRKIQEERIKESASIETDFNSGVIVGLSKAESILYRLQEQSKENGYNLWYTGSPNDIKPDNRGTYILVMRAGFDSEDGIEKDGIYIDADYWNGIEWESFETGEDKWQVLYFTKLKWLMFPLPKELGIKRSDDLFIES